MESEKPEKDKIIISLLGFNGQYLPIIRPFESLTKECVQSDYNGGKPFIPIKELEILFPLWHFYLLDDNGTINSQEAEKRLLHASVVGNGVLEGFGTANPSSEEDYFSDSVTTFDGSALAAVRWKDAKSKEPAVLKVWTDDGCQVMINIENN